MNSYEEENRVPMESAMIIGETMIYNSIDRGHNYLFSPPCLTVALNMVASGSKGQTQLDFLTFLAAQDIDQLCNRSLTIMSLLQDDDPAPPLIPEDPGFDPPNDPESSGSSWPSSDDSDLDPPSPENTVSMLSLSPVRDSDIPALIDGAGSDLQMLSPGSDFTDFPILTDFTNFPMLTDFDVFPPPSPPDPPPPINMQTDIAGSLPLIRRRLFPNAMPGITIGNRGRSPVRQGQAVLMEHAVWVDSRTHPLKPIFVDITESIYKALVKDFDFRYEGLRAREEANSWAEKTTKGLVRQMVPLSMPFSASMCVTSVTCFSRAWQIPFLPSNSGAGDFRLLSGGTIRAPFMTKTGEHFFFRTIGGTKILQLPYLRNSFTENQYSMFLFLPYAADGLRILLRQVGPNLSCLRPENFELKMERLSRISVPKFVLGNAKSARLPFGASCHLYQKEFLRVDEEGSLAVEYPAREFVRSKGEGSKAGESSAAAEGGADFVADHPFMFMIVQEVSLLTVFVGVVLNPLLNESMLENGELKMK